MRKHILLNVIALLAAVSDMRADDIVSRPVGFLKIRIGARSHELVCMPFLPIDPSINAAFRDQLTGSTNDTLADHILTWNPMETVYSSAIKMDGSGDVDRDGKWYSHFKTRELSRMAFEPGEGFFIQNRQGYSEDAYLMGAVILDDVRGRLIHPSLNLIGYMFTAGMNFERTDIAETWRQPEAGLQIADDQITDVSTNAFSEQRFRMGRAYWYDRKGEQAIPWVEARPYENVFPSGDQPPKITDIRFSPAQHAVVLRIACTGKTGEALDIFYQDLSSAAGFRPMAWQVAAENIPTAGATVLEWKDNAADSRAPVTNVEGRCYLIGRADIDLNGNGLADARECFVMGRPIDRLDGGKKEALPVQRTGERPAGTADLPARGKEADPAAVPPAEKALVPQYWERLYLAGSEDEASERTIIHDLEKRLSELNREMENAQQDRKDLYKSEEYMNATRALAQASQALRAALSGIPEIAALENKIAEITRTLRTNRRSPGAETEKSKADYDQLNQSKIPYLRQCDALRKEHEKDFPDLLAKYTEAQKRLRDLRPPASDKTRLESERKVVECNLKWEKKLRDSARSHPPAWWAECGLSARNEGNGDKLPLTAALFAGVIQRACQELNTHLPGGAGDRLNELTAMYSRVTNDHPVSKVQLRHVASLFYDRFWEIGGITCLYPWGGLHLGAIDMASAEIGEMKYLFSFDVQTKSYYPVVPPGWWPPAFMEANNVSLWRLFEPFSKEQASWDPGTVLLAQAINISEFRRGWDHFYMGSFGAINKDWGSATGLIIRANNKIFTLPADDSVDISEAVIPGQPFKVELIYWPFNVQTSPGKAVDIGTVKLDGIDIVDYGIYGKPDSAAGNGKLPPQNQRHSVLLRQTDRIPATLFLQFGLQFRVKGTPMGAPISLKSVHVYPDPKATSRDGREPMLKLESVSMGAIGELHYIGYTFDTEAELIPGIWSIQVWYDGKMYAEKKFTVVRPEGPGGD